MGFDNFLTDFDLVNLIRSKRLHGLGLHMLMKKDERNLAAQLAYTKPIVGEYCTKKVPTYMRYYDDVSYGTKAPDLCSLPPNDVWYHIENV